MMKSPNKWLFKGEEVELEAFTWEVEFENGEKLKQYDDNGNFHQIKEWQKVKILQINNLIKGQKIILRIKDNEKPIYYFENYILNNGKRKVRIVVFGIENKCYFYGFENGDIIFSTALLSFNF